jgi:transglutaminase-like putative cysteine protease
MDLALRYVTRFRYRSPVWDSHNALRACPITNEHQTNVEYRLTIEPAAKTHSYIDHWGTRVDTFGVRPSHRELVVDARASVSTSPRPQPEPSEPPDPEPDHQSNDEWLYTQPTGHTRWTLAMASFSREIVAEAHDVTDRIRALADHVHGSMTYAPGATKVGADPTTVWDAKEGVCQDYAHVTIALLRSIGIPARYVSGYFYAADPQEGESPDGAEIAVQTHAWVEASVPGFGWWGLDPTNGLVAGERHVKIGHGRDYDDVTPLRGIYYGDTDHDLAVEVTMGLGTVTSDRLPDVVEAPPDQ